MSTTVTTNGLVKSELHLIKSDDRWIYVEYDKHDNVIGLNFMQGAEDYELFKKDWCKPDHGLTEFYQYISIAFPTERLSVNKLSFINSVCWTYITAERCLEDYRK
jgi:hypothetical protein